MEQRELNLPIEGESKVDLFKKREIRKVMHGGEWWFSVKDVLESLTDTTDGSRYAHGLRERDEGLRATWSQITKTLDFETATRGKQAMRDNNKVWNGEDWVESKS